MVYSEPAAGNDAVHMDMVKEFLVPGVENLDDAGGSAKIFLIGGKLQKGLGTASMEEAVKKLLITVKQGV